MLHFFKKPPPMTSLCALLCSFSLFFAFPAQAFNASTAQQILNQAGLSSQNTAVRMVSMKTGQVLFEQNADKALMPASNMKVITSAAALHLLKPEFRFKTTLYSNASVRSGVLGGDLYLKGYGDPVLNDDRLGELVQELRFAGVESIAGNLYVDDSFFDAETRGKGWKETYGAAAYSARISALSLNLNTVEVQVKPGQMGQAANVRLKPENTFFDVVNKTRTGGGQTRLKISRQWVNNRNQIVVSGQVNVRGRTESERINLDKPGLYVGNVAQSMLKQEGIQFQGKLLKGNTPAGARILASTLSPPLKDIVTQLNKDSVNLIAENLLKFMGANFMGAPGTAQKGAQVVKERFLISQVGIDPSTPMVIADGSGLSPLNRLTATTLSRVLEYMFQQFDVSVDFMGSLAISGVDGTLRKRMNTPLLKRRVRAKTGFINGVSALSGYVYTQKNEVIIFSFLMNHFTSYGAAIQAQQRLCELLATTP